MSRVHRLRRSLAFGIVAPFAVALVLVFSAAAIYLGRTVRQEGLRELAERAQLLADTLAYNAELPMLARDAGSVRLLLEGAAREADLLQVSAFDAQGHELALFSPSGRAQALKAGRTPSVLIVDSAVTTQRGLEEGQEATAFALDPDLKTESTTIGHVRLLVSTGGTSSRTRIMQAQIAAAGFGLLLVCVAIGLGVVRVLGRPLRSLVHATRRVAGGDLSVRVEPSSSDEIGELAEAFNRMAADLEIARAEVLAERAELEHRVALRTAELQRAQETLIHSEKMSAVGQLVAGVAHELNNPLTVVLGYAGLIREKVPDPALRRKIDTLIDAAKSSAKIVRNLLAFARKQKPEKIATDLNDVVAKTVSLRAYDLRNERIEVDYQLDPALPPTWADPHQLQQVVLNILVNAEQAIHDTGKPGRIRFTTRAADVWAEVAIEDDGPGMPPEVRSRVFEPFFTTKDVGRGTGLGLSICYGIMAEHGGTILLESEVGRFTRFTLRLPIHRGPVQSATNAAQREAAAAFTGKPGLRLLVIDDDPNVLSFVQDAFNGLGVSIERALGGRDGIACLSGGQVYDAILSDMRMPEVDGRAVFRFVHEQRPELECRLIFATGDVANPESTRFVETAGRPVLEKPFSVEALREAVRRVAAR